MEIEWKPEKAEFFMDNYFEIYDSSEDPDYIRDNREVADSQEEFIMFLTQGLGFNREQLSQEVFHECFGYTLDEANEMISQVMGEDFDE